MLNVQNISINYGNFAVVKNISFTLGAGKIIALLGANGAGKTTILRSLNASLPVAGGEISLDGKSLNEFSRGATARKISVVAQETETKFPVTVLEFILAGRFARGTTFGWETENDLLAAEDALAACDLKNFENRLMNQLSGGTRQRVVFARTLATEAKILLLDEPTANLDLAHQASMFRLVKTKCETENFSAVLVTHDLNLAAEFADEILLLKNGATVAQGAPEKVLTIENLMEVFDVKVLLDENPSSGKRRVTTIF